ncbi:MAG TPA: deoxyribodipyrimidine photo-lyase [Verrucomicrobiae bacterium]|nr:deoxyribodipyrimidine photo-lyase [Verrucomicrobiae bacterium]
MSAKPALVWFRLDLRLADNDALHKALSSHPAVIPVFVWAPEEEAPWAPGAASRWWLHYSLIALEEKLAKRGSTLILRRGPTEEAIRSLAAETGAEAIYWNRRYEPAVIARDAEIKRRLNESGLAAESLPGNLLWEPWNLRNSSGKPFQVFTAFWRACQAMPAPPSPGPAPDKLAPPARWPSTLQVSDLDLLPEIDWAAGLRETWQPGEKAAAAQLNAFLEAKVAAYPADRDRPDHRGTSRLSPHLHFGEISARQVWHYARRKSDASEPFLRQIAWREFAHHLLFHFPHTPKEPLRPEFRAFPWQFNAANLKAWTRGKTGYPLVDAGMRELWRTGWMHNRVRMVAASFLVKHLLIPWQEGAAWFWDTLVDADLANNTMGWQWVAGCGADAAPYFRIFNPALQAGKFDPQGEYIRRWAPESQPPIVGHTAARARALAALARMMDVARESR